MVRVLDDNVTATLFPGRQVNLLQHHLGRSASVCVSQQLRGGTGSGAGVAAECPRLGRPDPATSQQSSKGARTLLHFAARIYLK